MLVGRLGRLVVGVWGSDPGELFDADTNFFGVLASRGTQRLLCRGGRSGRGPDGRSLTDLSSAMQPIGAGGGWFGLC